MPGILAAQVVRLGACFNSKPTACVTSRRNAPPPAPAKSLGRFRSNREKTRKAEISRDFSAFFAPNFFRISIDPFSIFLRVEGFELPKGLKHLQIYDIIGIKKGGDVLKDKIKSFIYYGSENYISLSFLRTMVPAAYLFLGFTGAVAGIAGNAPILMTIFLSLIVVYAIVVYTFQLWCPQPSFSCRFAMSAFSTLSLSIILQSWMFLILLVGKYIDVWDIVLVAALQIISSAIYFLITRKRINKGIFKAKKSSKTSINIVIISGASFAGMRMGKMLRGMNSSLAATLAMIGFTCIAVLCSIIATMHIMKFYYCKNMA